ncbi:anti-Muellerian hormone type-2 receptor-like [Polymixia lowei]
MIQQQWVLFAAVECVFLCIAGRSVVQGRRCAFQVKPHNIKYKMAGNVSGSEQLCAHTHCCVGYFLLINGEPEVDLLACDVVEKSCPDAACEASTQFNGKLIKCVCNADLCNANITWKPKPDKPRLTCSYPVDEKPQASLHGDPHTPLCSCRTPGTSQIDSANVELQQIVGQGHFAAVWQGIYQGSVVAVKVFPARCEQEFTSEKKAYQLPLMEHAGIIHFLGAGRNLESGEWLVVLELAACGSLQSFLCEKTSNWISSLKLSQSLSQGLAYLHSDLHKQGVHKPAVAHRDLSCGNVLVRADGTCALSDFGCSTVLRSCPGHPSWQHTIATMEGRAQVGTLRYMPPEMLEGSAYLSSGLYLMQGDVYALGLLLWEIWMRCSDLFEDSLVPEHHLPYEAELGANVTLEGLIQHVSHMNKRPAIPKHWKQVHQFQGSVLEEIVMNCWDHDADARLTAQCVVDRLLSL